MTLVPRTFKVTGFVLFYFFFKKKEALFVGDGTDSKAQNWKFTINASTKMFFLTGK